MSIYKGTQLISGVATPVQGARNIGQIIQSTIPLVDAGLHLLDGALIDGSGIYSAFVDYIASIYDASASYFTTEASWQDSVTNYGVCGKFVYDSVNNTVRLPKYSNKIYTKGINSTAPVVGNGKTLGITNGTHNLGIYGSGASNNAYVMSLENIYGTNVGTIASGGGSQISGATYGITTDGTKSGIIADLANITTSLDGYYYIVIATSTKTDIQVDIDEIATDLNGKVDKSSLTEVIPVIAEFVSGQSGYRIWSSGYCEQRGYSSIQQPTINFLKTFADTNYGFICQGLNSGGAYYQYGETRTTSSITITSNFNGGIGYWKASGYLASGEY